MSLLSVRRQFLIFLLFLGSLPGFARTPVKVMTLPNDSVLCPGDGPECAETSLIQKMNEEQLNRLIDFLMELDTIPFDLINEINIAVAKFKPIPKFVAEEEPLHAEAFPGQEYYSNWDMKSIFPVCDQQLLNDSAMTLTLESEENGSYFHPFPGLVTSNFGWRDKAMHNGIDIDLNKGDKVAAAFDGMVRIAKFQGGFGNLVVIRHYNGLETVYAHLSKIKVKPGQVVISGQTIGLGGSTGHSTGSHLHFETRFRGMAINPRYFISFGEQKLLFSTCVLKKTKWGMAAYAENALSHTVEKGETLFDIAKRYGITTNKLKEINHITSGRLKKGQVILIAG